MSVRPSSGGKEYAITERYAFYSPDYLSGAVKALDGLTDWFEAWLSGQFRASHRRPREGIRHASFQWHPSAHHRNRRVTAQRCAFAHACAVRGRHKTTGQAPSFSGSFGAL